MERSLLEKSKPYIAMICLQFGYAGMNIVTKVSLNSGMSHYVLVVYRNAFATVAIAPFALMSERKVRPKMTFPIFMQIFLLGLLGPVIDQNFYYAGLKYTSPVFSCAMSNMLPVVTFILAIIFRMEKMEIKKIRWQAKVVGTLVTVGGSMVMAFYKGHYVINMFSFSHPAFSTIDHFLDSINASIHLVVATFSWSAFFILQAITLRKYPAQLSVATLVCFLGTLQSMALTFVMDHKPSVWTIGFDMNLFAAAYAGIISSGVAYYVQGLVTEKRGPFFVTTFSPLTLIIVAILSSILLGQTLYIGGVLGALVIVMGMYFVLWGEYKEKEEEKTIIPTTMIKVVNKTNNRQMVTIFEDIESEEMESRTNEERRIVVVAVNGLHPESPMIAMEAPMGQRC